MPLPRAPQTADHSLHVAFEIKVKSSLFESFDLILFSLQNRGFKPTPRLLHVQCPSRPPLPQMLSILPLYSLCFLCFPAVFVQVTRKRTLLSSPSPLLFLALAPFPPHQPVSYFNSSGRYWRFASRSKAWRGELQKHTWTWTCFCSASIPARKSLWSNSRLRSGGGARRARLADAGDGRGGLEDGVED